MKGTVHILIWSPCWISTKAGRFSSDGEGVLCGVLIGRGHHQASAFKRLRRGLFSAAMMDVATWQDCILSSLGLHAPDCLKNDLKSIGNTLWMTSGLAARSSAVQVQQLRILWLSISAFGVFERNQLGGMRKCDIVLKLVPALRPVWSVQFKSRVCCLNDQSLLNRDCCAVTKVEVGRMSAEFERRYGTFA